MPPKRKAPAQKAAPTKADATVLQPKSTNTLKRPLNEELTKETNEKSQPKAKRASTSTSKTASKWDITGEYTLACANRFQPLKTDGFSLKIYYELNQLYAKFKFGQLSGVMRMCPLEALRSKANSPIQGLRLYLEEFEKACNLADDCKPSPKNKDWLMRWRGKEDSGRIFGGETKAQGEFNFKYDTKAKDSEVNAMTVTFGMVHRGKHIILQGSKVANLEVGQENGNWSLAREWESMFSPEWEIDSESDVESDGSIYKKPKDPPKGGIIKAKNKPGPNPGFMPNSLAFEATQSTSASSLLPLRPLPQWRGTGKYNVTSGTCYGPMRKLMADTNIDTTGFSLKVFYCRQSLPHQVYADFKFDKLEGLMRLCPRKESSEEKFPVAEFEKRCYLKEEKLPGPDHLTWAMRWRGTDGGMQVNKVVGGEEESLGAFDFKEEPSFPPTNVAGVKLTFFMIYSGLLFSFDALKVAELDAMEIDIKAQQLERRWKSLYNPEWDENSDSDSDSESNEVMLRAVRSLQPTKRPQKPRLKLTAEQASSSLVSCSEPRRDRADRAPKSYSLNRPPKVSVQPPPKTLPPAGVIDRSGPGLWKDHPGQTIIENPPDWAWNLAGHWKITAPMLSEALDLDPTESLKMKIHVSNYPFHTRVGRQLWADFRFGSDYSSDLWGYIRFCPASTPDIKECNLKQFENFCRLEAGQWAGPSEEGGHEKWLWRWRGKRGSWSFVDGSDEFQDEVEFSKGDNGEYKLKAVFTYQHQKLLLTAVKDRESTPPKGNPATILNAWDSTRRKQESNRGCYIVPASYGGY